MKKFTIYNKDLNEDEVKAFVLEYYNSCLNNKNSRIHSITHLMPTNAIILDYGCGWGINAIECAKKNNTVIGIDLDQNNIEICNIVWGNSGYNLTFEHKAIENYPDKYFDCILSNQCLEHVHNCGYYLSEINRCLKNNGQLIISIPNILTPRVILKLFSRNYIKNLINYNTKILQNYNKGRDHIHGWDAHTFVALLGSVGFKLNTCIHAEGIPFPTFHNKILKWIIPLYLYKPPLSKILKNFSYTLIFSFTKVKSVKILQNE